MKLRIREKAKRALLRYTAAAIQAGAVPARPEAARLGTCCGGTIVLEVRQQDTMVGCRTCSVAPMVSFGSGCFCCSAAYMLARVPASLPASAGLEG